MASLMTRLGLAAAMALSAGTANAAILTISDGDVLISDGGAYTRVAGTVEVAAGTSIIVNPGGAAVLAYAPGCAMAVPAGSITTVAAATSNDGCPITDVSRSSQITTQAAGVAGAAGAAGGAAGGAGGAAGAAGGAGAAAGGAGAAAGAAGAAAGAATISASTIAVGAVGAGAVATAAVTTKVIAGGSQKPASP